ncbi:hypothetical protein [Ilumatobacter nonamiensis]|uniref:hypothetical protein n=1 Tax=Ilumatobacter nonamiensis TaxID=467093 RepID=UPI00058D0FD4|nr:hypothetical protein [Ilumatobacter nonamiensis]
MNNPRGPGDLIVRIDVAATALFAVTAITAAILFDGVAMTIAAVVALVLFFVGIAAFLWSFWNAVQRSRGEQVAVTQLYLLAGGVAPRSVRAPMLIALAVQCAVALVTAISRPNSPDGSPGNSLALGVLVPLFGFGMNGLWAAFHGRYRDRVSKNESTTDQNESHG